MDLITNNIEPTLPVLHELKLSFEIQQLNVQIFRSPLNCILFVSPLNNNIEKLM